MCKACICLCKGFMRVQGGCGCAQGVHACACVCTGGVCVCKACTCVQGACAQRARVREGAHVGARVWQACGVRCVCVQVCVRVRATCGCNLSVHRRAHACMRVTRV